MITPSFFFSLHLERLSEGGVPKATLTHSLHLGKPVLLARLSLNPVHVPVLFTWEK